MFSQKKIARKGLSQVVFHDKENKHDTWPCADGEMNRL